MGMAAAYVTDDWEFVITHLGLKFIAWTHKGKNLAIPFCNVIIKMDLQEKISLSSIFFLL
jgi:hypothetical protein